MPTTSPLNVSSKCLLDYQLNPNLQENLTYFEENPTLNPRIKYTFETEIHPKPSTVTRATTIMEKEMITHHCFIGQSL